jgi:hypothetical protein
MRTLLSMLIAATLVSAVSAQTPQPAPALNATVQIKPQLPSTTLTSPTPSTLSGGAQVIIPAPTLQLIIVPKSPGQPGRVGP